MVKITTATPNSLLAKIRAAIAKGTIKTWSYDSDGDFTHTPTQWNRSAWLRPTVTTGGIELRFIAPTTGASREVFAVYQGRFQEMMIAHFPGEFSLSSATPNPTGLDSVVTAA